jgi:hypothetical protein
VEAVMVGRVVSVLLCGRAALLQRAAPGPRTRTVAVPGPVTMLGYEGHGRLVDRATLTGPSVTARVAAGGFTVLHW